MGLPELKNFVRTERHLPGIKSAEEYKKAGSLNVGELEVKPLEKVEELTLYNIQLNQELTEMEKQLEELQKSPK
jgi:hypothetical protein